MMSGCASSGPRLEPNACIEPVKPAYLLSRCELPATYPDSADIDVLIKEYLLLRANYRELCGRYNAGLTNGGE